MPIFLWRQPGFFLEYGVEVALGAEAQKGADLQVIQVRVRKQVLCLRDPRILNEVRDGAPGFFDEQGGDILCRQMDLICTT